MRRRIDLGQKVTGREEARLIQKRQKWTARNKNRPEHENPFLAAIKPDNANYGEPGEGYEELRARLENLEFGNFPGYFNYRKNAKSDIQNSVNAHDQLATSTTIPKGQRPDAVEPNELQEEEKKKTHNRIGQQNVDNKDVDVAHVDKRAKGDIDQADVDVKIHSPLESGLLDERLRLMKKEWFQGKDVLDIGCNRGHVTYAIAKMFEPNFILGIDIDMKMINMANRDLHLHIEDDILKRNADIRLRRTAKLRLEDGTTTTTTSGTSTNYTEDQNQFPLSSYISHGPLALSCSTHSSGSLDSHQPSATDSDPANRQMVDQNEINTQKKTGDNIGGMSVASSRHESLSTGLVEKEDVNGGGDDDPHDSREFEEKLSSDEHHHQGRDMTIDHNNGCREQQQLQRRQELNLFPNNIVFVEHNYVLSRDDLVEKQTPFFDTIVCLSVTKWIHLNYRDEGLRRFFKRMYRHLRPNGGLLILEAQPFDNYSRRKKLSDRLRANYYDIKFKPDQFDAYLLSDEVGFRRILDSNTTDHECAGFKRPLKVYLK